MQRRQLHYERNVSQFLSVYRFFSYALAVGVMIVLPVSQGEAASSSVALILGVLAIYTVLKVFIPVRLYHRELWSYLILGIDLVICVSLVLLTGGLRSGLLLYSLSPILSAALRFEQVASLVLAALSAFPLFLAHTVFSHIGTEFVWILEGNWLSLLVTYTAVCFLVATMAHRTNLNIYRRIESDVLLEERRRISQEVHDSIAQSLGYLNMEMRLLKESSSRGELEQTVSKLAELRKVVEETYYEVRESIDSLRLDSTGAFALFPALREYLQQFSQRTGINADLVIADSQVRLSPLVGLQLLRIAQEALSNVRKHSQADKVVVSLKSSHDGGEMVIKDNGKWFIPSPDAAETSSESHHGLKIMRERAESLGGTVTVTSTPGEGTEVVVRFPHRS